MIVEKTITRQVTHLTTEELAERYRMNPGTIANWRVKGDGPPFIKFGNKVLYALEEIESWEKSRVRRSTVDEGRD